MASPSRKNVTIRPDSGTLSKIRKAAKISDTSINKFIIKRASAAADEVIRQHNEQAQANSALRG